MNGRGRSRGIAVGRRDGSVNVAGLVAVVTFTTGDSDGGSGSDEGREDESFQLHIGGCVVAVGWLVVGKERR